MKDNTQNNSELILYTDPNGLVKVDAILQDENVWLTQQQIADLFQKGRSTITEHISDIIGDGELDAEVVCRNFRHTTEHGAMPGKTQQKTVKIYNLDMIIAVGLRVRSNQGTQFRKWAIDILREYIQKGFALNDEQLKRMGGGAYWDELRDRFRDIRSSEKVFWRQVLDIFSTSVDYDPQSNEAQLFFKKVQNKMHFAVHGNTAAEIVYNRADSDKDFMGLRTFNGSLPSKSEVVVAKNYLTEDELKSLNRLVSGYLDFAEERAEQHIPMYMTDWSKHIGKILSANDKELLQNAGSISHEQMVDKATSEYEKFRERTKNELTPVEKHFLENLKKVQKRIGDIND